MCHLILQQSICQWLVPGICVLNENVLSGVDCDTMTKYSGIFVVANFSEYLAEFMLK